MVVKVRHRGEVRVEVREYDTFVEIRLYQSHLQDDGSYLESMISMLLSDWDAVKHIVEDD